MAFINSGFSGAYPAKIPPQELRARCLSPRAPSGNRHFRGNMSCGEDTTRTQRHCLAVFTVSTYATFTTYLSNKKYPSALTLRWIFLNPICNCNSLPPTISYSRIRVGIFFRNMKGGNPPRNDLCPSPSGIALAR